MLMTWKKETEFQSFLTQNGRMRYIILKAKTENEYKWFFWSLFRFSEKFYTKIVWCRNKMIVVSAYAECHLIDIDTHSQAHRHTLLKL